MVFLSPTGQKLIRRDIELHLRVCRWPMSCCMHKTEFKPLMSCCMHKTEFKLPTLV
ncbi:uncharacterized protein DS421_15g513380 [Arachis hypogaea]|nr:uncharacterized protein DS421_15g513380 [Arachis hypogaea]